MTPRSSTTVALALTAMFAGAAGMVWAVAHASSEKVRRWSTGSGRVRRVGRIGVRQFGSGENVVVLIPGIAASEAFYGRAWDELGRDARVFVVDTIGFGSAVDAGHTETRFTLTDHVAALESGLSELGLAGHPVTVVGHSMGASLAIDWAATTRLDVQGVVAFDAPLYESADEAHDRVGKMGWFEALLGSGPLAESVCAWMCRHHRAASVIAIVINPRLPVRIATDGVKHTWASYIGAFDGIVTSDAWRMSLAALAARNIPVRLIDGEYDPVPVPGRAVELAHLHPNVTATTHPGGHDLPLAQPTWCARAVRDFME